MLRTARAFRRMPACHLSQARSFSLMSQHKIDPYLQRREEAWESELSSQISAKSIVVTLPDGGSIAGVAGETTPFEIARKISPRLAKNTAVARVGDSLWDLSRPLEDDCELLLYPLDSDEGREVNPNPLSKSFHQVRRYGANRESNGRCFGTHRHTSLGLLSRP